MTLYTAAMYCYARAATIAWQFFLAYWSLVIQLQGMQEMRQQED